MIRRLASLCLAALLLPASYISRISPAETVKGMRSEELGIRN